MMYLGSYLSMQLNMNLIPDELKEIKMQYELSSNGRFNIYIYIYIFKIINY